MSERERLRERARELLADGGLIEVAADAANEGTDAAHEARMARRRAEVEALDGDALARAVAALERETLLVEADGLLLAGGWGSCDPADVWNRKRAREVERLGGLSDAGLRRAVDELRRTCT